MKFYRKLGPIKAITFDLDNTLYDNSPIINKTTIETHSALQCCHPTLKTFTMDDFENIRNELLLNEPEIRHDVSECRFRAIQLVLIRAGLSSKAAKDSAYNVMNVFHSWRNIVTIPQETHSILSTLSMYVPLVVITNGNADPNKLFINQYFQFSLRAGPDGRSKPSKDMYHLAAKKLGIMPKYILHVGDDLMTDVVGSLCAGMQACWINVYVNQQNLIDSKTHLLPHIEISKLNSLISLF